ncbi:polyprenyl synthetase family protein [Bacillus thermotolerans]|uniref:polyprenyl synthetase family protein n=1 Tax=Bacillus thermotolerans TaxID=1221996 RepID=UPI0012FE0CF6|nr:polyprenyl synthetase family protein [Bacillus thermotolerans]
MNIIQDPQLRKDISIFAGEKLKDNRTSFADSFKLHFDAFSKHACHEVRDITACLEGMMLALDIIDDIQDDDNGLSIWMKKGQAVSLNVAISLMVITLSRLLDCSNKPDMIKVVLRHLSRSIEGQHQDLYGCISNIKEYIDMIRMKSGSLVAMANTLGAMLAGYKDYQMVEDYSYDLGIAAQIGNDIQDVMDFEEKSDWKLKKKTLPIIYLLNPLVKEGEIVRDYYNGKFSFESLQLYKEKIIEIVKKSGALNFAVAQKILHERRAIHKIESLPITDEKISMLKEQLFYMGSDTYGNGDSISNRTS